MWHQTETGGLPRTEESPQPSPEEKSLIEEKPLLEEESLAIATPLLQKEPPCKAEPDPATVRAIRCAQNILGYADRSEQKLKERLLQKGFRLEQAQQAVRTVKAQGLLQEQTSAQSIALYLATRQWYGRRRIRQSLFERGYPQSVIDSIDESDIDYPAVCKLRLERFCKREISALLAFSQAPSLTRAEKEERFRLQQKVYAHAVRYGFSAGEYAQAKEEIGF